MVSPEFPARIIAVIGWQVFRRLKTIRKGWKYD